MNLNRRPICGKRAIIERWSSGGTMCMAKCANMTCPVPNDGYPSGHNLDEVIKEWNARAMQEERSRWLDIVLTEALRQWNDFLDERKDCTMEDFAEFTKEIACEYEVEDVH